MKIFILIYGLFFLIITPVNALTFVNNSDQNAKFIIKLNDYDESQKKFIIYADEIPLSANSSMQKSMESFVSKMDENSTFVFRAVNEKTGSVKNCDREVGQIHDSWTLSFTKDEQCYLHSGKEVASGAPQSPFQLESLQILGKGMSADEGVQLYRMRDTNKLVAVKAMRKQDQWDLIMAEVNGIINVGKSPYAVKPISVLEKIVVRGKQPWPTEHLYVWLVMEPYLGGTLGDVIGKLTGYPWDAYESALGSSSRDKKSLSDEQAKFYIANLALILDSIHKLGWAWGDVKPENVLIDNNGYLKAVDFGRALDLSKVNDAKEAISKDWRDIGQRIISNGFRITFSNDYWKTHDPALHNLVGQLSQGKITSLEEIKNQAFFNDFDWDKMKRQEIKAPYIPEEIKMPGCPECVPYRVNEIDEVYISPEYKADLLKD